MAQLPSRRAGGRGAVSPGSLAPTRKPTKKPTRKPSPYLLYPPPLLSPGTDTKTASEERSWAPSGLAPAHPPSEPAGHIALQPHHAHELDLSAARSCLRVHDADREEEGATTLRDSCMPGTSEPRLESGAEDLAET